MRERLFTEVRLTLPLARGETPFTGLRDIRILVVDDEADCRALFSTFLRMYGAAVKEAADGREALRTAEEFRPHIVLSDIMMPVMDGYTFLREFRRSALGRIPVLAVSASEREEARALSEGFAQFIQKPVELEDLLHAVSKFAPADS